jgi:hypothetical protein
MKKNKLYIAIATTLLTTATFAEVEITGKITYEGAAFTGSGNTIGGNTHNKNDVLKSEVGARFYLDGEIGEESTWHAEIQGIVGGDTNDSYTQNEVLREAYIDTNIKDWSIRAGKQQVVWGTADGIKLLDMINPTDYTEMAQNSPEDSRIPTWMINAETELENGSNLQFIVSQPKENIFAGLNRDIDTSSRSNNPATGQDLTTSNGHNQGSAFIMKGVDSITGKRNGFLNGVPDLGSIAGGFAGAFISGAVNNLTNAGAGGFTVDGFAKLTNAQVTAQVRPMAVGPNNTLFLDLIDGTDHSGKNPNNLQLDGSGILNYFAAGYDTNLMDGNSTATFSAATNPNSIFEYMNRASFATFNTFMNVSSQYAYDMPDDTDANLAFRFKNTTDNGLNYSMNYSYNYDFNPIIDMNWHDSTTGEKLNVSYNTAGAGVADSAVVNVVGSRGTYGVVGTNTAAALIPTLRFTQKLERAHNIGAAMDYALDTESLGAVVLRGEFLYQKDVYSPIINRGKLAIGDLVGALKMEKGDRFKYVLGADITVLKNMMISAQFIQDRNLDYVDNNVDWDGTTCTAADGANCGVYTADFATMHMSNGFQKAEKNKEFYSLFISKPFGSSDQHRVNNIFMFEENGGKWNRFDVEYSVNDEMIASFEWNKYFGDENTQFGQLKNSSNIQLGFKYSF